MTATFLPLSGIRNNKSLAGHRVLDEAGVIGTAVAAGTFMAVFGVF